MLNAFAFRVILLSLLVWFPVSTASTRVEPFEAPPSTSYLRYLSPELQRLHVAIEDALTPLARLRALAAVDSALAESEPGTMGYADLLDLKVLARLKNGDRAEADMVPLAREALAIRREFEDEPARLSMSLYVLGASLMMSGDAGSGLSWMWESLELRRGLENGDPRFVAASWYGVGNGCWILGSTAAAIRAYECSIRALESGGFEDDWLALLAGEGLLNAYLTLGKADLAVSRMAELLENPGFDINSGDLAVVDTYVNFASFRSASGEVVDAEAVADLVQRVSEQEGSDLPSWHATTQGNIAGIYVRQHEPRAALDHALRSLRVAEASGVPEDRLAAYQGNVAAIEFLRGRPSAAEDEAPWLTGRGGVSNAAFPIRAWVHELRAVHAKQTGDPTRAIDEALASDALIRHRVYAELRWMRDVEALASASRRWRPLSIAIGLARGAESENSGTIADLWSTVSDARAMVTDVLRLGTLDRRAGERQLVSELVHRYRGLRSEVNRGRLRDGSRVPDSGLRDLELRVAQLESELAMHGLDLSKWSPDANVEVPRPFDLRAVRGHLSSGTALVSFVRYDRAVEFGSTREHVVARTSSSADVPHLIHPSYVVPSYAAFIHGAHGGEIHLVDLGPSPVIDATIERWRGAIGVGSAPEETFDAAVWSAAGRELRRLLWDPIVDRLGDPELVLTIPDGDLHFVNFDALSLDDGRFLAETAPPIQAIGSERALARLLASDPVDDQASALVVAGPSFSSEFSELVEAGKDVRRDGPAVVQRSAATALRDEFHPLPGALREGLEIANDLRARPGSGAVTVLTGPAATEARVRVEAPRHSILHFATHAFIRRADTADLGLGPEITAGIALAHVDVDSPDPNDDGLLFTDEILDLDLTRADWVVLSACETGLGDINVGEGVRGLRAAFESAGARTLILSLWKVHDQPTREWMQALYRARLGGAGTVASMRAANLHVLRARRARGDDTNPLYWASFVATGDWR